MNKTENFPFLKDLMGAYFNQDYSDIAETIEGLIEEYVNTNSPHEIRGVRADISRFLQQNDSDIEKVFEKIMASISDPNSGPNGENISTKDRQTTDRKGQ